MSFDKEQASMDGAEGFFVGDDVEETGCRLFTFLPSTKKSNVGCAKTYA